MAKNDSNLILTIRECPEKGFRLLMSKYKTVIYWHIRRLVVSHTDAQDATQETFIRVFRYFSQYNDDTSFTAWIYKIATNEALRILSRYKENQLSLDSLEIISEGLAADKYVDYSDLESIKLQNAILTLPTKQQMTFNLRYYDELEYDEIAEITTSTLSAAKMNYHLAKNKIIEYMNSHD